MKNKNKPKIELGGLIMPLPYGELKPFEKLLLNNNNEEYGFNFNKKEDALIVLSALYFILKDKVLFKNEHPYNLDKREEGVLFYDLLFNYLFSFMFSESFYDDNNDILKNIKYSEFRVERDFNTGYYGYLYILDNKHNLEYIKKLIKDIPMDKKHKELYLMLSDDIKIYQEQIDEILS